MENLTNYSDFDVQHFVADVSFREWVLNPSPQLDIFWKDFLLNNSDKEIIIEQARRLLNSIQFLEEYPSQNLVENSLKKALLSIAKKGNTTPIISIFRRWWAVAAILLIVIPGALYFLTTHSEEKLQIAKVSQPGQMDIAPDRNRAVLTLSDGSLINLDSARQGIITNQDGSEVLKFANGQIEYAIKDSDTTGTVLYNTITTPNGGQYQVELSDGSKIWLNAASSITFPTSFSATQRSVTMAGEVYFEVAHESSRPFRVHCGDMEIVVLGTFFNINAYLDEPTITTTLLQGAVKVKKGNNALLLRPGEQAVLTKEGDDVLLAKKVNMEEVMAWKNGKFIFQDASLSTIIPKLKRWYDIETVVQEGKKTDDEYVGVISRYVPLSTLLNMLEKTGTARFEIKDKTIIIKYP